MNPRKYAYQKTKKNIQSFQIDKETVLTLTPEERYLRMDGLVLYLIHLNWLPGNRWINDLLSVGALCLWRCCQEYDSSKEIPFAQYCAQRVRYAFIDELRRLDTVTRRTRKRIKRIDVARDALWRELREEPTEQQVMQHAFPDRTERRNVVRNAFSLHHAVDTLDILTEEIANLRDSAPPPDETALQNESFEVLKSCVDELSKSEKALIQSYYYDNRMLAEIGAEVGVTESRICQRINFIRTRLKRLYFLKTDCAREIHS